MSSPSFPFQTVVVTSPSFTSAEHSQKSGPLCHLATTLPSSVQVLGTSDPYGARCGSGGGTLAAIDYADAATASAQNDGGAGSVLIVHAGGESSRCPTQMILGKAWSSLPVAAASASASASTSTTSTTTSTTSTSTSTTPATPQNPTALLVSELSTLLTNLPQGSVVVAASDVLLGLPAGLSFDFAACGDEEVIGLAVPSDLDTAKNHGVYVLEPFSDHVRDDDDDDDNDDDSGKSEEPEVKRPRMEPSTDGSTKKPIRSRMVMQFLQKPSPDRMRATHHCTFGDDLTYPQPEEPGEEQHQQHSEHTQEVQKHQHEEEECAWIDTGVVVFLPKAAEKLRNLASGVLNVCTHRGLDALYQTNSKGATSIEEFAKDNTVKIELYTHLLLALSTAETSKERGQSADLERYVSEHATAKISSEVLTEIYQQLSSLPFRAAAVPAGRFVHLGTTLELVDFLVSGSVTSHRNRATSVAVDAGRTSLGHKIGLCGRFNSFLSGVQVSQGDNIVLCSSTICSDPNKTGKIGSGTVVEHTSLRCPNLTIGNDCLVSGLRGSSTDEINIPDGMCIQMLPLRKGWSDNTVSSPYQANGSSSSNGHSNGHTSSKKSIKDFVYMCLAVADPIKGADQLYNRPMDSLLNATSLEVSDLWDESIEPSKRMLWNAKIHPVMKLPCSNDDGTDVELDLRALEWIAALETNDNDGSSRLPEEARPSLDLWRSLPRLSLSQIRNSADPAVEFAFRDVVNRTLIPQLRSDHLNEIGKVMHSRKHIPTDFRFAVDTFSSTKTIGGDVQEALSCLDNIILTAFEKDNLDVAGRAFMVLGSFLRDLGAHAVGADGGSSDSCEGGQWLSGINQLRSTDKKVDAAKTLSALRDDILSKDLSAAAFNFLSAHFEQAAFALTEVCVRSSPSESVNEASDLSSTRPLSLPMGSWAIATAPVRIDLCGGWSDTPPISYEYGGAVAGLAVRLDGMRPLSARCRLIPGKSIQLKSEGRELRTGDLQESGAEGYEQTDTCTLQKVCDLSDFRNPRASCALLKCAIVFLGIVPLENVDEGNHEDLQPYINRFCQSGGKDVGIEIISTSLLPKGSGLGTSSILGGCALAAIERCVGTNRIGCQMNSTRDDERLVLAVLTLEQLLSSGGGWQDQVNGLIGGLKIAESKKAIPLQLTITRIPLDPLISSAFDERLFLAFSGQPRLARNILRNVLTRWGARTSEITATVQQLVEGAGEIVEAAKSSDIDRLAQCVEKYWELKKAMAGLDSGVEPPLIADILHILKEEDAIVGGTLCGAGGGGFLSLFSQKGTTLQDIQEIVANNLRDTNDSVRKLSWHRATIDQDGLSVHVESSNESEDFDIGWHK